MRVLVAARDGFDVDFVAAHFLSEGGEVGGRGHDLQFVGSAQRRAGDGKNKCKGRKNGGDTRS